jgi:hypothetical protein
MAILKNTSILDEGYFGLPVGGYGDRPEFPNEGDVRWNSDASVVEFYDGTEWFEWPQNPI